MSEVSKKELPKLVKVIQKYFWKLVVVNGVIGVIALVILFLLPEWYRSTATVISEQASSQLNVSTAVMSNLGFAGGIFGQSEETLRYIRYLNSRTIADNVIDEFDLMNEWDKDYKIKVYKKLAEDVAFVDNEDASISITVSYKEDPKMAADIANFYVDELQRMIKKYENDYVNYVSKIYSIQKKKLYEIETSFSEFQKNTGIYDLEAQSSSTFEILAQLELQKMQLEIQRDSYEKFTRSGDPKVRELDSQVKIVEAKIKNYKAENNYSNIAVDKLSDQGIEFLRLYRDLMIQEQIVQFLAVENEQAKLSNQKEEVKLNVIDHAVPADYKYKPRKMSILILILMASGLLSLMTVNIKETYFN